VFVESSPVAESLVVVREWLFAASIAVAVCEDAAGVWYCELPREGGVADDLPSIWSAFVVFFGTG